ncbi:MAG: SDR family NAD(P)-dependent oxidoreductase [Ruminococcaceae bacterium]|nr:SDR family NAD(P)-dependent oxidoreductase [Oscillospiraceae bacterium]
MSKKVCVITGAGGILCSSFAKEMAKNGYAVALLDLNEEAAAAVAAEIVAEGGVAKAYKTNVLEKACVEEVHEKVLADLGKCSVLINGAGGNNPRATTDHETFEMGDEARDDIKTFFNLDKSGFEFVFNLNIMGTLLPTQVFAKDMIGEEGCSILNISSMNAFTPLTKIPAYSAAKAGVSNFTQWLAVHFAETGIRVNAIAPGFFVTNQNRALLFNEDGTPTARTGKILRSTPMNRFGEANELLGALRFLTNPAESGFITGVVLPVDGGFSAFSGV